MLNNIMEMISQLTWIDYTACFVAACVLTWIIRRKKVILTIEYLVAKAEYFWLNEKGAGHDKYNWVIEQIYLTYPKLKYFVTENQLKKYIEKFVKKVETLLKKYEGKF